MAAMYRYTPIGPNPSRAPQYLVGYGIVVPGQTYPDVGGILAHHSHFVYVSG